MRRAPWDARFKVVQDGLPLLTEEGGNQKEDCTDQKEDSMAAVKESVNDGSSGHQSRPRMTEQGRTQQPTINGSGKGKLWLATTRVRGQWLAIAAKGGSGQRRDCHSQR